jgi:hypothetical protein
VLREARLGLVRVTRVRELELATGAQPGLHVGGLGAALALDADHLGLLGDADLGAGGEVDEDGDAAGEVALGVWDGGGIVGDEEAELELWVVV